MILGLEKRSGVNISKGKSIVKIIMMISSFYDSKYRSLLRISWRSYVHGLNTHESQPKNNPKVGSLTSERSGVLGGGIFRSPDIKRGVPGTWGPCMYVLLDRLRGAVN